MQWWKKGVVAEFKNTITYCVVIDDDESETLGILL